jgi:hypothetical protein
MKKRELHSKNKGLAKVLNLLDITKEGAPLSGEWVTASLKDFTHGDGLTSTSRLVQIYRG